MTDEIHPSYPNPTIAEALCEIGFEAQPSRLAEDFVRVWPHFEKDFSSLEVHADVLTSLQGGAVVPGLPPVRTRFSAWRENRRVVVQFAPGVFAVGTLAPYLGWVTFRRDIAAGWRAVQSEWGLPRVNHLLVRYINQVPLPAGTASVAEWLMPGPFATMADSMGPFRSQVQTGTGTPDVVTVTVEHQRDTEAVSEMLVVDIERSLRGDFAASPETLLGQIDALHSDVWRVFNRLKGRRWSDVLEGRPQEG